MKSNKLKLTGGLGILGLAVTGAAALGTPTVPWDRLYLGVDAGITRTVNTSAAPDLFAMGQEYAWDAPAAISIDDNAVVMNIGSALNAGVKAGFKVNESVEIEAAYNRRGNYAENSASELYWIGSGANRNNGAALFGYKMSPLVCNAITLNLNLFPRPLAWDRFKPFISAGAGLAINRFGGVTAIQNPKNNTNLTLSGNTQSSFTWQLGAGIEYIMTKHFALDLAYRFVDMGNFTSGTVFYDQMQNITGNIQPIKMTHVGANEYYVTLKYSL